MRKRMNPVPPRWSRGTNWSRFQRGQMIDAAGTAKIVSTNVDLQNEAHARALAPLAKEDARDVRRLPPGAVGGGAQKGAGPRRGPPAAVTAEAACCCC